MKILRHFLPTVLAFLLLHPQLFAGVESYATVTGTDKGVNVTLPSPYSITVFSGTLKATVNGNATSLYCIDLHHYLAYNQAYQDVESTNDTLSYILNNYYPYKTGYSGMLAESREASAVQLALWHLTDALDINGVTGSSINDIKSRALAIVNDALANAHSFNLNTFIINIPAQSFAIGSPINFTVQAFNDHGLAMENVTVTLSVNSGSLSATSVITDMTGVTPSVTLTPAPGQTTATITATGVVGIPSGTKYYHVADPNGKQKLILATPTTASRTITKNVNWSNAFNLVLSKTADIQVVNNGDFINYTITVKNTGTGGAQNVVVSDQLASILDFVSCIPNGAYNPGNGLWNAGTINAGDSATLKIKVKVNYAHSSSQDYDFGAANDFNLFVLDTLIQPSADTEGKVAVGGYADLRKYSVGDKLPAHSGNCLVVGNHLTFISGNVANGRTTYENYITSTTQFTSEEGIFQEHVIDFNEAKNHLENLSNQLSTLTETDTVASAWGHVILNGNNASQNVFHVDGSTISAANNFTINVPSNSTAIVNVSGKDVKWTGGFGVEGTTKNKVLLNFYEADTIHVKNINITGAVLAPKSVLDFPNGLITGQVMVKCMFGAGQFNLSPFDGSVTGDTTIANFASVVSASQASMPSQIFVPSSVAKVSAHENGTTEMNDQKSVPTEFNLLQNYPNPFNPTTTIEFTVADREAIKLVVYNMLGQEVRMLVNSELNPGKYAIPFKASELTSGVYLYRISSPTRTVTKKMTLLK